MTIWSIKIKDHSCADILWLIIIKLFPTRFLILIDLHQKGVHLYDILSMPTTVILQFLLDVLSICVPEQTFLKAEQS